MNRNLRESLVSSRNVPALSQHRRGHSLTPSSPGHRDSEDNLDLFSKNRRSLSVTSSDDSSDVSVKLGKLSVGSAKVSSKTGLDDLLSAADAGKHDYDWLLTPPGTPLFPSSDGTESKPTSLAPKASSRGRSTSTTKASRLSVSQSENNHSTRPARSSSVTRSSVSTSYTTLPSKYGPSILNTSSASVSSYIRPSSPSGRLPSTARPSSPSTRQTLSRASTPSRVRPATSSSSVDKPRPSQTSRSSTPSSRPQVPANLNSTAARSSSRPSTPTRRSSLPSTSTRVVSNGHSSAPTSRPSSPSPRPRPPQQPLIPPDFPMDTPPNLRTTLPSDRPVSAGRSRPGVAVSVKSSQDTAAPVNVPRRASSPSVTRGRLVEPPARTRSYSNGHAPDMHEPRRTSNISESATRKPLRSSTTNLDSTGFGRTISKKSLDMAIRHMDIRNGNGGARSITGTALFPQSIRSASAKSPSARSLSASEPPRISVSLQNGDTWENGHGMISKALDNGRDHSDLTYSSKLSAMDLYESSRYDALLLKEDLKNTNWLHSIDDKSEQGSIFDNGFESLPEPFGLL